MLFKAVADMLPASCSIPCTLERRKDDVQSRYTKGSGYNAFNKIRCVQILMFPVSCQQLWAYTFIHV